MKENENYFLRKGKICFEIYRNAMCGRVSIVYLLLLIFSNLFLNIDFCLLFFIYELCYYSFP